MHIYHTFLEDIQNEDFIQALSEIYIDTFPLLTLIKSYMKSPPPHNTSIHKWLNNPTLDRLLSNHFFNPPISLNITNNITTSFLKCSMYGQLLETSIWA